MAKSSELRKITLHGPKVGEHSPRYLWTLSAGAPHFGFRNAVDGDGRKVGATVDHVHPLRVLAASPTDHGENRRPRLIALHLLVGSRNSHYQQRPDDVGDSLTTRLTDKAQVVPAIDKSIVFRSLSEPGDSQQDDAAFVQVVAEPLLQGEVAWPVPRPGVIEVPELRLVAGRVPIEAEIGEESKPRKDLKWLHALGIVRQADAPQWCHLWLTPEGIEFVADLPFPGSEQTLRARVLLAQVRGPSQDAKEPGMALTFLDVTGANPEEILANRRIWLAAWYAVTPAESGEETLHGLKFAARRDGSIPGFRWRVSADGGIGGVEVPGESLRMELVSPEVNGAVDGVARLRPAWVRIAGSPARVRFGFEAGAVGKDPAVTIRSRDLPDGLEVTSGGAVPLELDCMQLAGDLRAAYGLAAPPSVPRDQEKLDAAGPGFDRPLLSAFVPIEDGWLQLPVPNLGPIDPGFDAGLVVAPREAARSVLDGFLRFKYIGPPPQVLSAHATPTAMNRNEAPWSVTFERASGIKFEVWVTPGATNVTAPLARLDEARSELFGVAVSMRGLIWVSADRPDALEALPRLGAGPGAFVDVALEGLWVTGGAATNHPLMGVEIQALTIRASREPVATTVLAAVTMDITFNPAAERWAHELLRPASARAALVAARGVLVAEPGPLAEPYPQPWPVVMWRRHPTTPLVASMPMTRSATSCVRPLESRDLMPLVLASRVRDQHTLVLLTLQKTSASPFLALVCPTRESGQPLVAWPNQSDRSGRPEQGIAFAALGVPGVEIRLVRGGTGVVYEGAVRYDLPVLDEAFATASLPPPSGEQRPFAPQPIATALDWPALARLWQEQDRKLQNARVVDSYLSPFLDISQSVPVKVDNLVRGLVWTTNVVIELADGKASLPYGSLQIGTTGERDGNAALLGYSGLFAVEGRKIKPRAAPGLGDIEVLGFSPATFRREPKALDLDLSCSGAGAPSLDGASALISRAVTIADKDAELWSLARPYQVDVAARDGGGDNFVFWFKDVLVRNGEGQLPGMELAFDVWDEDEKLARAGFEWRFAPDASESAALRRGRDELPFFGFWLEPLRLGAIRFNGRAFESAQILCRLSLGPRDGSNVRPGNLVTMTLTPGTAGRLTAEFVACDLSFALAVAHDRGSDGLTRRRPVTLRARLNNGAFAVVARDLAVVVARTTITLNDVKIHVRPLADPLAGHEVIITARADDLDLEAGQAALTLLKVQFRAGYTTSPEYQDLPPRFIVFQRRIAIQPQQPDARAPRATTPVLVWVERDAEPGASVAASLSLFGVTIVPEAVQCDEGDAVVVLTAREVIGSENEDRFASVTLGLVARTAPRPGPAGTLWLTVGYCEGELIQKSDKFAFAGAEVSGACVRFEVTAGLRAPRKERPGLVESPRPAADGWVGTVVVSATATVDSEIRWPSLAWDADSERIPVPGDDHKKANTGRATIKPGSGGSTAVSHKVTWTFAEHRLTIGLAGAIADRVADAVWATPVTARHELTRDQLPIVRWSSIDSVAIGAAEAIVPRFAGFSDDATMFAARYLHKIAGGKMDEKSVVPGMRSAGLGTLATVLQGALGADFRRAFWADGIKRPGLMMAGGFLGALKLDGATAAPLLRLPVLAGVGVDITQSSIPGKGIELSWTDGPAARVLALARAGAPSPANASLDAITAAMVVGSRSLASKDAEGIDDPVAAILVEQSVVHTPAGAVTLTGTPFFLASAVGVERVVAAASKRSVGALSVPALSLVAGSLARRTGAPESLAAVLEIGDAPPGAPGRVATARLVVLGDDLTIDVWTGPAPGQTSASLAPTIAGIAVARHVMPRVGMVIARSAVVSEGTTIGSHLFPVVDLDEVPSVREQGTFADHGRGSLASFSAGDGWAVPGWLHPVVDGPMRPIRDDGGSGIAGLTRTLSLGAHAGPSATIADDPSAAPELVWLSHMQVPVYLPLQTRKMVGLPIGWLTPAPPRVRLPSDADVLAAVRATGPATRAAAGREVQPFLPPEVDAAAVGERAGVVTARRARLLGRLAASIPAYDPASSRFGRPGQAGSSFARKLRTPRPGPLPANVGDPARDRRVQGSALRPGRACAAFVGSADVVEGDGPGQSARWTVTVVAAPELRSTVSDRWDGSIRLVCHVEVQVEATHDGEQPASFLLRTLLPVDRRGLLESRALLKVGEVGVAYRRLFVVGGAGKWSDPSDGVRGATVVVILDPREVEARHPGPPHPEITTALSVVGPLPAVELQWTVHPSSSRSAAVFTDARVYTLTVADRDAPLAAGAQRAPLTLRLPLYPVTAERGALPLTPATLLFSDPAYDRDLTSLPAEDGRLVLVGGQGTPAGRGELRFTLAADRRSVHCRGVVTFMADLRHERPMNDIDQLRAEAVEVAGVARTPASPGGDLLQDQTSRLHLRVSVQPRRGPARALRIGAEVLSIEWARVYELSLATLREADGEPARLAAGDMLVLESATPGGPATEVRLWDPALLKGRPFAFGGDQAPLECRLALMLTDEPMVAPPPALYAALMRTYGSDHRRLAVPLHAQSPLPARVDLIDPVRDFRKGMMRRHATFVWTLFRPEADLRPKDTADADPKINDAPLSVTVVKSDRNGQMYLPTESTEFTTIQSE